MGQRVSVDLLSIVGSADHFTTANNHGANRYFTQLGSARCLFECQRHPVLVIVHHWTQTQTAANGIC